MLVKFFVILMWYMHVYEYCIVNLHNDVAWAAFAMRYGEILLVWQQDAAVAAVLSLVNYVVRPPWEQEVGLTGRTIRCPARRFLQENHLAS